MSADRGFSLVEMVVVLVLVGVLALLIVPRISRAPVDVGTLAEKLASDIRYVQTLSMTQGERHCLYLGAFAAGTSYQLRKNNCLSPVEHPATGTTNAITFTGGVTYAASNLSVARIEFDTRGRPTTINPVAATASILLSVGSESRTVRVSGQTGRVVTP